MSQQIVAVAQFLVVPSWNPVLQLVGESCRIHRAFVPADRPALGLYKDVCVEVGRRYGIDQNHLLRLVG